MLFSGIFLFIAGFACLMIVGTSGFVFYNVFKNINRPAPDPELNSSRNHNEPGLEAKRRALQIIAQKSTHQPAQKCQYCAATIDSTAELSADGRVRCNYCNEWSSIY